MDRGRVGYAASGNRFITEQTICSRYKTHIERINVIMNRKPGTSKTLNNKLNDMNTRLVNIRYQAMREEFNEKAARENKALLKRIGKILTAPATINENNLYNNKKTEFVRKQLAREQAEIATKNKVIFSRIHKAPAYYHVKDWEDGYRKQLSMQRFVRQVVYNPRKSKVSTTQEENSSDGNTNPETKKITMARKSPTISHVGRVRTIKNENATNSTTGTKQYKGIYNIIEQGIDDDQSNILKSDGRNNHHLSDIDNEDDECEISFNENRQELASVERLIKICHEGMIQSPPANNSTVPNSPKQQKRKKSNFLVIQSEGDVSCWLVNYDLLLIIATANSIPSKCLNSEETTEKNMTTNDDSTYIQAEADILVSDLASVKGHSKEQLLENNCELLLQIAKDIVNTVEIRLDVNNDARLILSLVTTLPSPNPTTPSETATAVDKNSNLAVSKEIKFDLSDNVLANSQSFAKLSNDIVTANAENTIADPNNPQLTDDANSQYNVPSVSQDDLANMITDSSTSVHITKVIYVPITLYENGVSPRVVQRKPKQQQEYISLSVVASITGDSTSVNVTATVLSPSNQMYKHKTALEKDDEFSTSIGLPSIAHADAEMTIEYLHNVVDCCSIHHNITNGTSQLVIRM